MTGAIRKQVEQLLQARWEKLFGFAPIALDENLFVIGGNSLLAARLLADVRPLIGRVLPLSILLVAPTIRLLAAMIKDATKLPSSPRPVLLRAGSGSALFLVLGLSGSVMGCWALVGVLKSRRPVYGLQAQGLDGEQFPQQQVLEKMNAAMKAYRPRPYHG